MGPLPTNLQVRVATQGCRNLFQLPWLGLCPRTFSRASIFERFSHGSWIRVGNTIFRLQRRLTSFRDVTFSLVDRKYQRACYRPICMMFTREDVRLRLQRSLCFHRVLSNYRLLTWYSLRGARLPVNQYACRRLFRPRREALRLLLFPFPIISRRFSTGSHRNQVTLRTLRLRLDEDHFVTMLVFQRFRLHLTTSTRAMFFLLRYGTFPCLIRLMNDLRYLLFRDRAFLFRLGDLLLVESTLLLPFVPLIICLTRRIQVNRRRSNVSLLWGTSLLNCSTNCVAQLTNVSRRDRGKVRRSFRIRMFARENLLRLNRLREIHVGTWALKTKDRCGRVGRSNRRRCTTHRVGTVTGMPKFLFRLCVRGQFILCFEWDFDRQAIPMGVVLHRTTRSMVRRPMNFRDLSVVTPKNVFLHDNHVRVRRQKFTRRMGTRYRFVPSTNYFINAKNCFRLPYLGVGLPCRLPRIRFGVVRTLFRLNVSRLSIQFNRARFSLTSPPIRCQGRCKRTRMLLIRQIAVKVPGANDNLQGSRLGMRVYL